MKCKQLGLRVLSTAAIMSIVSSIAAPAFAGTYYLGESGAGDITITADGDYAIVKRGDTVIGKENGDEQIVIKGGTGTDQSQFALNDTQTSIGESTPVTQETKEEEKPVVTEEEEQPEETAEETPAEGEVVEKAKEEESETQEKPVEEAQEEKPVENEEKVEEPGETVEETQEETETHAAEPTSEQEKPEQPEEVEEEQPEQETQIATMEVKSADTPIAQSNDSDVTDSALSGPVDNVISVINNWVDKILNITLDNVNIDVSTTGQVSYPYIVNQGKAAMDVSGKGHTAIELEGNNVLKSGASRAGLEKNGSEGTLTIQDKDKDGSLEAVGKDCGAGIGSTVEKTSDFLYTRPYGTSNINITGGKIHAVGGEYGGAGIGSGSNNTANGASIRTVADNINITGGTITAECKGNGGAGIGSGRGGDVGSITIGGDAVIESAKGAQTGYGGAGIGAGMKETDMNRNVGGNVDKITIEGNAHIKESIARSGSAGIGAGANGSVGLIEIKDHAKIDNASNDGSSGGGGAGIGGGSTWGCQGSGNATIEISTDGEIHATGSGAGIGGGGQGNGKQKNTGIGIVKITNGKIYATSTGTGAGIGGGTGVGKVTITGGQIVNATGCGGAAGIGNGLPVSGTDSDSLAGFVTITGGWIGDFIKDSNDMWQWVDGTGAFGGNLSSGTGSGIGGGAYDTRVNATSTVTISGTPFVAAVGGRYAAAIGAAEKNGKTDAIDTTGLDTSYVSITKPKGETENTTVIIPTTADHNWVNDGEHHDATCVSDGYQDQKCSNDGCNATQRVWDHPEDTTHAGDSTKHDYEDQEWVTDKEATCTEEGKKHQVCKNAPGEESHYNVEVIPATGHQHTEIRGQKEATCQEPGYTGDKWCTDCNTKLEDGHEIPQLDHVEEIKNAKDPSCTEDGYTGDKWCTKGNHLLEKGEVIPKLNHDYEEKVTKEPTCTEDGEKTFTCKRGDDSYTEKIPATGHQHTEVVGAKEPTCTEPGYTGDTVCKDCGEIVKKGEVIPATGHQHTHIEGAKDATETEDGYTGDTVCDDCGAVVSKGESIPAKGVPAEENTEKVSTPELWVIAPDTIRQTFTVSQSGTVRTYTSPYNSGTLTGTMEILQYLQEQGVETIVFTTNQRTSRFAVADLLALVNEGDVFYLQHMDANEPTLLVIANDHSDLLNG